MCVFPWQDGGKPPALLIIPEIYAYLCTWDGSMHAFYLPRDLGPVSPAIVFSRLCLASLAAALPERLSVMSVSRSFLGTDYVSLLARAHRG